MISQLPTSTPSKPRVLAFWSSLILAAIILIATALRLWQLQTLPPGLWYDAAVNGSDARMIMSGAGWPIYFAANNGREPLFIYLQALSVAILGPTPYALLFVSALMGVLTVPAIYFAARALWAPSSQEAARGLAGNEVTWTALLAAAGIAISFWHVSLSRRGLRAIMLPLASALVFGFFWRAWTYHRRRDYVYSGIAIGVALYTYTAARLIPGILLAFVILELALDVWKARRGQGPAIKELRGVWRQRLIGLALMGAVSAFLILPLAITAFQRPSMLSARVEQVSILDTPGIALRRRLAENVVDTIAGFYDRGDTNARVNLPGRPMNDVLQAVLFTAGILAARFAIREPRYRLLLIWLGIMLMPIVLTPNPPNFMRGSGVLTPLVLFYAAGGMALVRLVPHVTARKYAPLLLLGTLVLLSGALTARDYFIRWPSLPRFGAKFVTPNAYEMAPQTTAEVLARLLPRSSREHPILISYSQYIQPHTLFAIGPTVSDAVSPVLLSAGRGSDIRFVLEKSFDARGAMVLVWQEEGVVKSAPVEPLALADADAVRTLCRESLTTPAPGYQADPPEVCTGSLPKGAGLQARTIDNPLDIRFANGVRLIGYDLAEDGEGDGAESSRGYRLRLFWKLQAPVNTSDLAASTVFVGLANDQGVGSVETRALPESHLFDWLKPGAERILETAHDISTPPDMPSGKAHFEVGLLGPSNEIGTVTAGRIGVLDAQGRVVADQVNLGAVMLGATTPQASMAGLKPLEAQFDGRIELLGWNAWRDPTDDNLLRVEIGWRALTRIPADYTAFVHLLDSDDQIVAQQDHPPGGPDNPTSRWLPGESVRSTFTLSAPAEGSTGPLRLRVGLYEPESGEQLPITASPDLSSAEAGSTYLMLPVHP